MNVYRLHPEYTSAGDHYAHWVDDGIVLMETPQSKTGCVLDQWPADLEFTLVRDGNDCDVYMNADVLCFTKRVVDELDPICRGHVEWLPLRLVDGETLFIFHPTETVPLGKNSRFRSHSSGDNIVEVYDYDFDKPDELPCCFLIPQPATSPAGKVGFALNGQYVTDILRNAMMKFRGVDFAQVFPPKPKRGITMR